MYLPDEIMVKYIITRGDRGIEMTTFSREFKTYGVGQKLLYSKFVDSDYFDRLDKLGDFEVATNSDGGYPYIYLDLGISEIHQNFYFVIGKIQIFSPSKTKYYKVNKKYNK